MSGLEVSTTPAEGVELAPVEVERLAVLEQQIEAGVKTFILVGTALAEVNEARLYRATHATFEMYLEDRWGMSRPRAYELIAAAEVVSAMADTPELAPENARQARALAAAPPEERAEVMVKVAEKGKTTAAAIAAAIAARAPQPAPVEADEPKPAPVKATRRRAPFPDRMRETRREVDKAISRWERLIKDDRFKKFAAEYGVCRTDELEWFIDRLTAIAAATAEKATT